jgi:SAM-dependent methyltransferase
MKYWDKKEKLFKYTDGVRQFFPLANEQLEIISRVVEKFSPEIKTFLDLGCGDGFLGHFIHLLFPEAHGVFIDISEEMINKARKRDTDQKSEFIIKDFGEPGWFNSISGTDNFDLIISGYSIHHITNQDKQRLYREIFELLNSKGVFINLEHVSSPSVQIEEMFNELFLDRMSDYHESINDTKSRDEIKSIYNDPEHKKLNMLEAVEVQCNWLEDIGFSNVDCYLKIFELALFGGTKN